MNQAPDKGNSELEYLLRMAEQKDRELESVLSYAADGIGKFACDEYFTILYYNDGLAKLVGVTRGVIEQKGFNSSLYIHPDDVAYVQLATEAAVNSKEAFELCYRLKHTTGKDIWVKVKGIFVKEYYKDMYPIMYLLFTNITELVEANEKLKFEKERYRAFTSLVHEQFFEYEAGNERCPLTLFGGDDYDESEKAPPTEENVRLFLDSLSENEKLIENNLLLFNNEHELNWYHISARGLRKANHQWVSVIGTCRNIQKEVESDQKIRNRESELIKCSETDYLTNIYNRSGLEKAVKEAIEKYSEYVCGVIDVDNFKQFNDVYGHVFGDEVLRYVADVLKKACSGDEFAGRVGGDEFFILFQNDDRKKIEERLDWILKEIAKAGERLSLPVEVSVSIGAVIVSKINTNFKDVYYQADIALYGAKRRGKNAYMLDLYVKN